MASHLWRSQLALSEVTVPLLNDELVFIQGGEVENGLFKET